MGLGGRGQAPKSPQRQLRSQLTWAGAQGAWDSLPESSGTGTEQLLRAKY